MPGTTPWFLRARLKTRQLMLLIAIAEEGNIHRAAGMLNMSQPAASKLLKDLEDVLGLSLFERLPRGMRPTWYGEALIRHARMALSSLTQAGQEIEALKTGRFGGGEHRRHHGCGPQPVAADDESRCAGASRPSRANSRSSRAMCCSIS